MEIAIANHSHKQVTQSFTDSKSEHQSFCFANDGDDCLDICIIFALFKYRIICLNMQLLATYLVDVFTVSNGSKQQKKTNNFSKWSILFNFQLIDHFSSNKIPVNTRKNQPWILFLALKCMGNWEYFNHQIDFAPTTNHTDCRKKTVNKKEMKTILINTVFLWINFAYLITLLFFRKSNSNELILVRSSSLFIYLYSSN